jgi:hypothetical protein
MSFQPAFRNPYLLIQVYFYIILIFKELTCFISINALCNCIKSSFFGIILIVYSLSLTNIS